MHPDTRSSLKLLALLLASLQAAATPVDVYILTGQSNSLGTTTLESNYTPGTDPADSVIHIFWANAYGAGGWPVKLIGTSANLFKPLQMQQGADGSPYFWGPEFGFARTLYAAGHTNFVIIKASADGGGNTLWDKATFDLNHTNGPMWGHLSNTVYTALGNLAASGQSFNVRGLLYIQGEANNASEAAIAGPRFGSLYSNLLSAINTAYPATANGMLAILGEIGASQYTYISQTTTVQQVTLAASSDAIAYVYTRDLPLKSDNLHFPKPCKLEIGRRLANCFLGRPTIVPVSFNAVTNAPDATTLIFDRYVPDTNAVVQGINLVSPNPYTGFANGDGGQARAGLLVTGSAGQVVFADYSSTNASSDLVAGQYNYASNGLPANWVDSGTNLSFTFADPYNQVTSALVSAVAFELVSPFSSNNVTVSLFDGRGDALYTSGTITNGRFGFEAHEAFTGSLTSAVSRLTLQSGTNVLWSVGHPTDGGVPDFSYNGWRLPSSYERWSFQIADPSLRGYTTDPDNDGAPNLFEYATGTDPTNNLSFARLEGLWTNGSFAVQFPRADVDDITWQVQGATNFSSSVFWETLATKSGSQPWSGPAQVEEKDQGSIKLVLMYDPASSAIQHFLRLQVSRP